MQKILDLLKLKTIYAKLLLSFMVIAVLAFCLSAISWLAMSSMKNNFLVKKEFVLLQNEIAQLQKVAILFLTQEQNNREYMRLGQSKYLDEYENIQKNIQLILTEIQATHDASKEILLPISEQLKRSDKLFKQIIYLLNERGVGEYGLVGQLDNLLAQLDRSENTGIQQEILQTALAEKIYLQSGSKSDQNNWKAAIQQLYQAIRATRQQEAAQNQLRWIEDYTKTAQQLCLNDSLLGIGRSEGLRQEFLQIIDNISPQIEQAISLIDKQTDEKINIGFFWAAFFAAIILIATTLIAWKVPILVTKPLAQLAQLVAPLETGTLIPKETHFKTGGDVGRIAQTVFTLNENLWNVKQVATEVGKGNFDTNLQIFQDKGDLGEALATMRNSLKKIATEEKQRNWTSAGIAKFAEILRQNESVQQLCHQVIKELVHYTNACQGAVYLYDETNNNLKLIHAHAYNQQRFLKKQIGVGEGLVGACFAEKKYTILDDLPEDYHYIEMGIGTARPKCLVLMPLQHADSINGIIELAAFHIFQPHEITFIEKIAESMSAALQTIRNNEKNKMLLEEARLQAEMLQAQEEEMRQTLEELTATQEEMQRKNQEISRLLEHSEQIVSVITQMPALVARCVYDEHYTMLYVNHHVAELLACSEEEVLQTGFAPFIYPEDLDYVNATVARALQKEKSYQISYRIQARDGKIKQIWEKGQIITFKDNTYIDFFMIDLATLPRT